MPVSFLTAEQERRYGRYAGEPNAEQLARHFHLDDADRELAGAKRWDHMRLGFAVQLGTVRFLGAFLDEPAAVPGGVAGHLAQQLGIPDPGCLTQYATARGRWLHSAEIKERHGYREFTDPAVRFRLARWLYALCWTGTDRPSVLFDRATVWLVTEKVLLPGASALERLVARIRARAARRLWRTLARDVTHEQRTTLDALLIAGEGGRPSPLDRLRDGPYLRSGAELSRAVSRLDEVRVLTLGLPAIDHVPPGRVTALARFATVAKAQAVARMPLERRTATLLAFVRTLEATAQDDVLDLFDIVVTALFTDAAKVGKKARLRTLRDLDVAALQLRQAGGVLMDDAVEDGSVRGAAFAIVPRAMFAAALEQIDAIVRPPGDLYFIELRAQTGKLRFLPAMLRSVSLGATPAGHPARPCLGRGDVASADGLRFVVPVRTIHSGPNPRYYGQERGVTFYNLVSDQFTGLNGITVPGTLRDSLTMLSVVLEQQTEMQPTEIMSDTGAYTDTIFGIFHLLGYQFSPRLADIGGTRFWRVDGKADYGALDELAAQRINVKLIIQHWEDLLRLAGSLKLGTVQAAGLIRTLQTKDRPTKLARALEELGRLIKTLYLLRFIDDEAYRRRILVQLNRGEGRHQLARVVFHGKRGELRQRYREGQEDQLGSLGLVVNVIVLWNTIYMDAALDQLRAEGFDVRPEDVARLSPLGFDHINMLGRYAFILPDLIARGELRPLRDPKIVDDES